MFGIGCLVFVFPFTHYPLPIPNSILHRSIQVAQGLIKYSAVGSPLLETQPYYKDYLNLYMVIFLKIMRHTLGNL
ncbi:hypothetical protein FDUTEX481_09355 [Tolypothrix sp. PCC 7601]|nr:hypothetical protein FDUTEX481_09355 [Tolypothrix sp. PCC 7601]